MWRHFAAACLALALVVQPAAAKNSPANGVSQEIPVSTAGMSAAVANQRVGAELNGGRLVPPDVQTLARRGNDSQISIDPLVLSPADGVALSRFKTLFRRGLANPVPISTAIRLAQHRQISTIIMEPAHPFTFALATTNGKVISTTRHGPTMPVVIIRSGANIVVLPGASGMFAWLNMRTMQLIASLLLVVILIAYLFLSRRNYSVRKRIVKPQDTGNTTFDMIAGQDHAKMELRELIESLRSPHQTAGLIVDAPQGVLLIGPPGNGKTMLVKALAKEVGFRFYAMAGSDFVEMLVGVGAARVRSLFDHGRSRRWRDRLLRRSGMPTLIFIDEIDAVGGRRGRSLVGNEERENTLNQLLVELDGLCSSASNGRAPVVVIAATNRADTLDEALLRRFPQQIHVMPPNTEARAQILKVHSRSIPKADVDLLEIARITPGFSGSNLASLVQEAVRIARRMKSRTVTPEHFRLARQRVLLGTPRPHGLRNQEQRRIVAVHEAGHAIVALFNPYADQPIEASIIPHGESLGHVSGMAPEDEDMVSRKRIMAKLQVMMAGRAAEEEIFGADMATSGATQDRRKAIELITVMITEFGLSENAKHIGAVRGGGPFGTDNKALPDLGPADLDALGAEVKRIFTNICEEVAVIVRDRRLLLLLLARALLIKETITVGEMRRIIATWSDRTVDVEDSDLLDVTFNIPQESVRQANPMTIAAMGSSQSQRSPGIAEQRR